MAGPNTLTFDDDNFESEVLKSDVPVLVDFWAEWCGPCQMLAPTIDELATEYAGKIKVGKVDVDAAQQTAMKYGIQNIPTVVLFDKGEPVERIVGARQKRDYQQVIEAKTGVA
ncbi:MAG: thioredoxin [Planctomycetota bacterium]|nr:MAG: thioredoxin [Planctomycetota bacterium]